MVLMKEFVLSMNTTKQNKNNIGFPTFKLPPKYFTSNIQYNDIQTTSLICKVVIDLLLAKLVVFY